MDTSNLKIGDEAWIAYSEPTEVKRTCPVCFGKREVTVVLGDESRVITPCDYCGKGYEGPRGWVADAEFGPRAVKRRVTEVRSTETATGAEREFIFDGSSWVPEPADVFPDEASALARAAVKVAEAEETEDRRRRWRKDQALRTLSWTVGYHTREAKDAERRMLYHRARATVWRERAAAERAAPSPRENTP